MQCRIREFSRICTRWPRFHYSVGILSARLDFGSSETHFIDRWRNSPRNFVRSSFVSHHFRKCKACTRRVPVCVCIVHIKVQTKQCAPSAKKENSARRAVFIIARQGIIYDHVIIAHLNSGRNLRWHSQSVNLCSAHRTRGFLRS